MGIFMLGVGGAFFAHKGGGADNSNLCKRHQRAMGSGGSVYRSASSLRTEIDKLRKRELDLKVNNCCRVDNKMYIVINNHNSL